MSALVSNDLYGFCQLLLTWIIIGGAVWIICLSMYRKGQLSMRNARLELEGYWKSMGIRDLEA